MLQQTVAGFEVRCCASQRLHQARHGIHSCVQAAAAARVAGRTGVTLPDIHSSAENGDGASVLCHVIADADGVNKRSFQLMHSYYTPLHWSALEGHLEVCRLLLECSADVEAKDNG